MTHKVWCIYIDENLEKNLIWWSVLFSPAGLQEIIIHIQNQFQLYDEIKFSKISKAKLLLYKKVIDILSWYQNIWFYIKQYPQKLQDRDYIDFVQNILDTYPEVDHRCVFVDYFHCRKWFRFEEEMVSSDDRILFCLREDSKANKLLQSTDLMLWCWGQSIGESEITSSMKKDLISHFDISDLSSKITYLK